MKLSKIFTDIKLYLTYFREIKGIYLQSYEEIKIESSYIHGLLNK